MTPAARASGGSWAIMLHAPRSLKAPIGCRFSHFRASGGSSTSRTGVRTAIPRMRPAAALMSSRLTSAAGPGKLFVGMIRRHRGAVGDAPPELRQEAHVLHGAGVVPRVLELVARLVIVLRDVLLAHLLREAGILADVLDRIADGQRRNTGLRQR